MKVLFDINVVRDIVGKRLPFYEESKAAFLKAIERGAKPMLALHAYPTLYYLLGCPETRAARDAAMEWIFEEFEAAAEGQAELSAARSYEMTDFEDALVAAAASSAGCGYIVTRNVKDFAGSPVRVASPTDFLVDRQE